MNRSITNTKYRTSDGLADYVFDFAQIAGGWRGYIVSQPDYGTRQTSMAATHRLFASGRHYICWDRPLQTLDNAKGVAALWADATQEYIRSGRFDAPSDRSHVYDWSSSAPQRAVTPPERHPPPPPGASSSSLTGRSQHGDRGLGAWVSRYFLR